MVNNINNNTYNTNRYENTNFNNKANGVPPNLPQEDGPENNIFEKLNKIQNKENMEFLSKIQKEIQKAELIAIKIVRGENPTAEELKFISKKYPELKETAENALKENNNLKEVFKSCKIEKQIQEIISKLIKNIKNMEDTGQLSKPQSKIKLSSVEELEKYAKNLKDEFKKAVVIAVKMVKGEKLTKEEIKFITEKYPETKKFVKETISENTKLKENLKECNTELKKQEVLSKVINEIKDKGERGLLSKSQVKIKLEGILDIKKSVEKEVIQLKKSVMIAVKIIKLGKLTTSENKFITEKYPEIKKLAQEIRMEFETLKEEIKNCSTDEKKQELLFKKISYIEDMDKKGVLSEIQDRLKKEAIDKIKEYEKNEYKENDMKLYLYPYLYLLSNGSLPKVGLIAIVIITLGILAIVN